MVSPPKVGSLVALGILVIALASCLRSSPPPKLEGVAFQGVVAALQEYEHQHPGRPARSWNDIAPYVNWTAVADDHLYHKLPPPYETYVFPGDHLTVPGRTNEEIVLIRLTPSRDSQIGRGRRSVIRTPEGVRFRWFREEEVRTMLAQTQRTLPQPNPAETSLAREAMDKAVRERRELDLAHGGPGGARVGVTIKMALISVAGLTLIGVGMVAFRWFRKR